MSGRRQGVGRGSPEACRWMREDRRPSVQGLRAGTAGREGAAGGRSIRINPVVVFSGQSGSRTQPELKSKTKPS